MQVESSKIKVEKDILTLLVMMVVVDFIQYDLHINSNMYILLLLSTLLICVLSKKTFSIFLLITFYMFILFTDITRNLYLNINFNSVYLLKVKYIFYIVLVLFVFLKKKYSLQDLLLCLLMFIYLLICFLKKNEVFFIVRDLIYYINLFILPYWLSKCLEKKEAIKILKIYKNYVYIFPFFITFLLITNRYYQYLSFKYTVMGGIMMLNFSYLIGKVTEKFELIDFLFVIYYLILFKFAIGSGQILLIIFLFFYFLLKKIKINFLIKIFLFILIISLFPYFIKTILKGILDLDLNPFLKYKFYQIYKLLDFKSIIDLLPSVRIRVGSIINIFYTNSYFQSIFGQSFGGTYKDISGIYSTLQLDTTAFSIEEIESGNFYDSHFFLANLYLKCGLCGIMILIYNINTIIKLLLKNKKEYIPVFLVFLYISQYGIKSIFIWSYLLAAILCLERNIFYKNLNREEIK